MQSIPETRRRRALVVAYHYPPEPTSGALRLGYLAKYLPEFGWDPVVVTRTLPHGGVQSERDVIRVGGAAVLETASALASRLSAKRAVDVVKDRAREMLFFPDRAAWWIPYAICAGLSVHARGRIDAIVTSAMPGSVHLVGCALSALLRIPWVADYRDLWHGNPYVVEPPWRARWLYRIETAALRRATHLTTITQTLAAQLAGLHDREVSVIPNTLDADEWRDVPFREPDSFRIMHAGSLYNGLRSPERLFAQIAALRASGEPAGGARLDFYGREPGNLLELAQRYGISDTVSYHGLQERSAIMRAERAAAVLLVIQSDDRRTAAEYGSKIYEYHAAGRPVIAIGPTDSVLRQYIDDNKIGWFAANDGEIRHALQKAYRVYAERRTSQFNVAGVQSAKSIAWAFADILDRFVRNLKTDRIAACPSKM